MTQIWVGGRQCGKTTRLIKWVQELGTDGPVVRVIVCHTKERARQLQGEYFRKALSGTSPRMQSWQFVSVGELQDRWLHSGVKLNQRIEYGIDDLDLVLSQLFHGADIALAVGTGVHIPLPHEK